MKRFLSEASLFILLLCGIMALALIAVPHNRSHYNYIHRAKMERLETLSGPRLVIIGGSNAAFGLDSPELKSITGLNVVNTASHASVGLKFMLDEAEARIKSGDVIVIMPEYAQFFGTFEGANESLTAEAIYGGYSALSRFSAMQWLNFICGIPKYLVGNIKSHKAGPGNYSAYNFNAEGDEIAHWHCGHGVVAAVVEPAPTPVDSCAVKYLAEAIFRFRQLGCRVLLLPPITIRSNYEANRNRMVDIDNCFSVYGIDFDGADTMFVFEDTLAYDTPYHMTRPAVEMATRILGKKVAGELEVWWK